MQYRKMDETFCSIVDRKYDFRPHNVENNHLFVHEDRGILNNIRMRQVQVRHTIVSPVKILLLLIFLTVVSLRCSTSKNFFRSDGNLSLSKSFSLKSKIKEH